jgi:hypothetical protein
MAKKLICPTTLFNLFHLQKKLNETTFSKLSANLYHKGLQKIYPNHFSALYRNNNEQFWQSQHWFGLNKQFSTANLKFH